MSDTPTPRAAAEGDGEAFDVAAAIEGMARVEEFNDQFRQPNPNGRYPICKPRLYDADYCERCGNPIVGNYPCPAVPRDMRWGENYVEVEG